MVTSGIDLGLFGFAGRSVALPIKAKAGTKNRVALGFSSGGGSIVSDQATFDLSSGSIVGKTASVFAGMQPLGDGWWKIWCWTDNLSSSLDRFVFQIVGNADVALATYQGDGTGTVLAAHAQAEYSKNKQPGVYRET